MEDQSIEKTQEQAIRRFVTYEEYLKAFYPECVGSGLPVEEQDETGDFGTNLAIESLNRHAEILKFGAA